MKKVVLFTTDLISGGVKQSTLRMCKALEMLGLEAHVISYEPIRANIEDVGGAHAHSLNLPLVREFSRIGRISFAIRRGIGLLIAPIIFFTMAWRIRPDVVFAFSYVPSILACLLKIVCPSVRVVVSNRQNPELDLDKPGVYFSLVRALSKWLYPRSDLIHSNLLTFHRKASSYYDVPPAQTVYFPNFYDFDEIRSKAEVSPRLELRKYLLCCGRLSEQKGHWVALLVYAELVKNGLYDGTLVMLGDGPLKAELEKLTKELNLENRVIFLSNASNPYPILRGADALLFPSIWEGFANVPVECMGLGVPVICAPYPGAKEALNGAAAYFDKVYPLPSFLWSSPNIPLDELSAMADKVMEVLNEREEWSRRSLEYARNFDMKICEKVIRDVIIG